MDSGVTGGLDLGDEDWAQRSRWKASPVKRDFELEHGGKLSEFSAARWAATGHKPATRVGRR